MAGTFGKSLPTFDPPATKAAKPRPKPLTKNAAKSARVAAKFAAGEPIPVAL